MADQEAILAQCWDEKPEENPESSDKKLEKNSESSVDAKSLVETKASDKKPEENPESSDKRLEENPESSDKKLEENQESSDIKLEENHEASVENPSEEATPLTAGDADSANPSQPSNVEMETKSKLEESPESSVEKPAEEAAPLNAGDAASVNPTQPSNAGTDTEAEKIASEMSPDVSSAEAEPTGAVKEESGSPSEAQPPDVSGAEAEPTGAVVGGLTVAALSAEVAATAEADKLSSLQASEEATGVAVATGIQGSGAAGPSKETKAKAQRGLLTGLRDGSLEKIASSMPSDIDGAGEQEVVSTFDLIVYGKSRKKGSQGSPAASPTKETKAKSTKETKEKAQRGLRTGLRDGSLEKIASSMPSDINGAGEQAVASTAPAGNPRSEAADPTEETIANITQETKAKFQKRFLTSLRDGSLRTSFETIASIASMLREKAAASAVVGQETLEPSNSKSAVDAADQALQELLDDSQDEESAAEAARNAARIRLMEYRRKQQLAAQSEIASTFQVIERPVESEEELKKKAAAETKRRRAEANKRRQRAEKEREKRMEELERQAEEERVRMEERQKELEEIRQKEKEAKQARRRAEKEAKEKQMASAQAEVEKAKQRLKNNKFWKSPSAASAASEHVSETETPRVRLPPISRAEKPHPTPNSEKRPSDNEWEPRGAPDANFKHARKRPAPINVDLSSGVDDDDWAMDEAAEEAQRAAQERIKAYRRNRMVKMGREAAQQVLHGNQVSVPVAPPQRVARSVRGSGGGKNVLPPAARRSAREDADALIAQLASGAEDADLFGDEAFSGFDDRPSAMDRIRAYRRKERQKKNSKEQDKVVKAPREVLSDSQAKAKRKEERKRAAARIKEHRLKKEAEKAKKQEEEFAKAQAIAKAAKERAQSVPRAPAKARQKPEAPHRVRQRKQKPPESKQKAPGAIVADDAELADDEEDAAAAPRRPVAKRRPVKRSPRQESPKAEPPSTKPNSRITPRAAQAAAKREALVERESKRAALEQETAQKNAKASELEEMLQNALQSKDGNNATTAKEANGEANGSLPLQLVNAHCQAAQVKVKLLRHLLNLPSDLT